MWHTFNHKDGVFYIATKAWSDFAAHIPLIRSFSWGKNFPPEYPIFPGEPIRYHFLFYAFVGLLEKAGLSLGWALNLPSIIGFWALLIITYLLTKLLFNKKSVAILAVIFLLFNGSFSFLEFFQQNPLSLKIPIEIFINKEFPSFGPYDGKIVSAFWNLNIFTNQRHLAGGYAIVLGIVFLFIKALKSKKAIPSWQIFVLGITIGLLPFYHKAAFLMVGLIMVSFFFSFPKFRRSIFFISFIAGLLFLPQVFFQFKETASSLTLNPGYLITKPLTALKVFIYWYFNLGLSLFLIPLGVFLAPRPAKKVFLALLSLFLIGNLVQFSPEIAANHKFFNLFLIGGNMFSAWTVYLFWQKKFLGKLFTPALIFFLTLSGVIDFFPIKNDSVFTISDAPKNEDILWIKNNTPPNSIFLNSSYLYHPASLAGRKIFLGWPYFPWSAGYNTNKRDTTRKVILGAATASKVAICNDLAENSIQFVSLDEKTQEFKLNFLFWKNNFIEVYNNPQSGLIIYDVNQSCL